MFRFSNRQSFGLMRRASVHVAVLTNSSRGARERPRRCRSCPDCRGSATRFDAARAWGPNDALLALLNASNLKFNGQSLARTSERRTARRSISCCRYPSCSGRTRRPTRSRGPRAFLSRSRFPSDTHLSPRSYVSRQRDAFCCALLCGRIALTLRAAFEVVVQDGVRPEACAQQRGHLPARTRSLPGCGLRHHRSKTHGVEV